MAEESCGLCMFPDLWDNSNDVYSLFSRLPIITSGRIGSPNTFNIPKTLKKFDLFLTE